VREKGRWHGVTIVRNAAVLDPIDHGLFNAGDLPPMYVAARTAKALEGMLSRGFTSIPDVGGGDHGLARAIAEGYFAGPRLFYGGKQLSQTGGAGDVREVQPPTAIIRSATSTAARLLQREGELGVIRPGALADLLVVDGNPLDDIRVLTTPERSLKLIMHDGRIFKNEL
jgi:imidazolonepropionase-like amidohydrolase